MALLLCQPGNNAVLRLQSCSLILGACLTLALPCAYAETRLTETPWGTLDDGTPITLHTLTNASGARASFTPLGAAIVAVQVPDRNGTLADVVLGFDNAAAYRNANGAYMGLTIGRYASRIFGTELELDGTPHTLVAQKGRDGSAGSVILHGGPEGFSSRVWTASKTQSSDGDGIRYTLVSPDGDQGFPGEMTVSVTYHWSDDHRLSVSYEATTDKTTVVNLTQHSYFNLAGAGNGDIQQHTLQINADFFTFALPDNAVTGEIRSVRDTPFDFTTAKAIGRDIDSDDAQMLANRGYNQNFVLRRSLLPDTLAEAAVLQDPASGRKLTVWTTEPGLFLYTANFIDTRMRMKGGVSYPLRAGVALETGHFPDSPNHPHFPRTTLLPGAVFRSQTVFAFSAE
jgi:aldose 1-epimerase